MEEKNMFLQRAQIWQPDSWYKFCQKWNCNVCQPEDGCNLLILDSVGLNSLYVEVGASKNRSMLPGQEYLSRFPHLEWLMGVHYSYDTRVISPN